MEVLKRFFNFFEILFYLSLDFSQHYFSDSSVGFHVSPSFIIHFNIFDCLIYGKAIYTGRSAKGKKEHHQ
jgi:hypothetical protein